MAADRGQKWTGRLLTVAAAVITLIMVAYAGRSAIWSPYYRITVQARTGGGSIISVNNLGHQEASAARHREGFYHRAYELFPGAFKRVLIIGAGSGTDVSVALANGVEHVDAVEIDPASTSSAASCTPIIPTTTRASACTSTTGAPFCASLRSATT